MKKVAEVSEPESYVEASQDAKWQSAMEEEMHALTDNDTWDPVDPPPTLQADRLQMGV